MFAVIVEFLKGLVGRGRVVVPREIGSDVVIFFVGPTGSGKSTFVNAVAGKELAPVGHTLSKCTDEVHAYPWVVPAGAGAWSGKTVFLVDTPGFDDTLMFDSTRVFKAIESWIGAYKPSNANDAGKRPRVAAVIYLQDITQKRVTNRQNVDFLQLQELTGVKDSYSKLVLVTYQWPENKRSQAYQQAEGRENELKTMFWNDLLGQGARLARGEDTVHDPQKVVLDLLEPHP